MTEFDPMTPENRRKYLGASDVPIVMDASPWKTPFELWEEKLGLRDSFVDNEHIRRGVENEHVALEKFELLMGEIFSPAFVKNPAVDWQAANLDGLNPSQDWLVEIKCPSVKNFEKMIESREIPYMYQLQMTYQAHVSKVKRVTFFAYEVESGDYFLQEFEPKGEVVSSILEECHYFWNCVEKGIPPEGAERNYLRYDDDQLVDLASSLQRMQDERSKLDKEIKEAKNHLITLVSNENAVIGDEFIFEKNFRKGNIDYSQIPELKMIDLEKYRKPPIEIWKLK